VRIKGHALTILRRLLEAPGAVVTREALRQELWGDEGTFVDFEQGLNTAVNRLRQVLGDTAERPRWVETSSPPPRARASTSPPTGGN
jgi:DNA-binding winged helix-turn-helix (wHTH) protein